MMALSVVTKYFSAVFYALLEIILAPVISLIWDAKENLKDFPLSTCVIAFSHIAQD